MLSPSIIPPPEGVDVNDMDSIRENMHLYQAKHFVFPFLAHALGTLIGAIAAAKIAASHKMKFALVIGFFFLLGGIAAVMMIPAPTWFAVLDLVGAYIPMAYFGAKLVEKK